MSGDKSQPLAHVDWSNPPQLQSLYQHTSLSRIWDSAARSKGSLTPIVVLAMEAWIAGFKANSIPLGIDQLSIGSGDHLSGFITLFVFSLFINILGSFHFPSPVPWTIIFYGYTILLSVHGTSIGLILQTLISYGAAHIKHFQTGC